MSSRYYRPWSVPYAPPNEDRPANPSQYHVVRPFPTGWICRYPILPPVGQTWSPAMMTPLPLYYPMMSYPLHTYIPTFGPAYPLYSQCVPMTTTAVQHLHTSEYTNQLSLNSMNKVYEQACHDLIEKALDELIREVVSSCIDDIITSYLRKANLLVDSGLSPRETHRGDSCVHVRGGTTGQKVGGAHNAVLSVTTCMKRDERALSSDEVASGVCQSLMKELMFDQLLQTLLNRDTSSVCSSAVQATTILNELLFEELMKLNWSTFH